MQEELTPEQTQKINQIFADAAKNAKQEDAKTVLDHEDDIYAKIRGPLAKFIEDIKLFFSLIKDYITGTYREVPWPTIAALVGTLLYVLSPIDVIPDFIPLIGLADDAAVVGICLKVVHDDLQKYKAWKHAV